MAHQLCNLVTFGNHTGGFTVRLVAGDPHLPS
jgi:hypothetical protein